MKKQDACFLKSVCATSRPPLRQPCVRWSTTFWHRNPTFACIGAIFGMGSSFMQSRLHGGNRFFGTMVGGFIGMGLFAIYMELFPDGSNAWVLIPLTFVGVIILILLCQHIWVGGVQPAAWCCAS